MAWQFSAPGGWLRAGYSAVCGERRRNGEPGFRPHAATANIVSANSTNVMTCTLVQYRQMFPMMNSSA